MSRMWFSTMVAVAMWAGAPAAGLAQGTVTIFGSGSGAFETPGVATAGVATATCTLDSASSQIACSARVHNIVNLTAGHLHVGGPGTPGPVVLGIAGLPVGSSDDFVHSWTWTESDLRLRSAQGVLKMADVFESCASGNCYINFHTVTNPAGEVRINMCPQGAAEDRFANGLYQINVCAPGR